MKGRINIIQALKITGLCIMTVVTFSRCSKLLDQQPPNALTKKDFFKTRYDAEAAISGVYDALQTCVEEFLVWGEYRGDLVITNTTSDRTLPYTQYLDYTKEGSQWNMVYTMIGRANIVIESVPAIPGIDVNFSQAEADAVVGEALFLRALGYFYLVRTFGDVPLNLIAASDDNVNLFNPKSASKDILLQIEKDLTEAESKVNTSYLTNEQTRGRATKGAVNALQADVFLWQAKYTQAAAAAKKVIDNSSLYTLQPGETWFDIFAQKNSQESIFEVQFDYVIQENNSLKGYMNAMSINNVLVNYFDSEGDIVRGSGGTYRRDNSLQFWKYSGLSADGIIDRINNDPNFIVYRLADVMLLCAEAEAHLGFEEKTHAIALLDEIRSRAGIPTYTSDPDGALDGTVPTSLLIDLILKERAMELACEGKRWFDLVRVAQNEDNIDLLVTRVVQSRAVGDRAQIRSRIIDPRSWYFPIGLDELNRNPNMKQNPFYQ